MSNTRIAQYKIPLLALGGIAAGFMNGLLGAGGGILLVFLLSSLLKTDNRELPHAVDSRDVLANALAAMLPVTAISVINYANRGSLPSEKMGLFIFPAVIGGLGGAWLLDRMNASLVRKIFAAIVIFSGISMIVRS